MKKQSSYQYFSFISHNVYNSSTSYKFAKHVDLGSQKHRKGVATVLSWIGEVTYHYLQKEQNLKSEFDEVIRSKEKHLKNRLQSSDYKLGVEKGFSIASEIINESKN